MEMSPFATFNTIYKTWMLEILPEEQVKHVRRAASLSF